MLKLGEPGLDPLIERPIPLGCAALKNEECYAAIAPRFPDSFCSKYMISELIYALRLTEEVLHESIEARSEALSTLRELGPPDLVHLIKASPRNPSKQVR
jgi:hypothetical protein